jgi:hypothetical protein
MFCEWDLSRHASSLSLITWTKVCGNYQERVYLWHQVSDGWLDLEDFLGVVCDDLYLGRSFVWEFFFFPPPEWNFVLECGRMVFNARICFFAFHLCFFSPEMQGFSCTLPLCTLSVLSLINVMLKLPLKFWREQFQTSTIDFLLYNSAFLKHSIGFHRCMDRTIVSLISHQKEYQKYCRTCVRWPAFVVTAMFLVWCISKWDLGSVFP